MSDQKGINPSVTVWRHQGRHLPSFMRDFHNQKDLFKTMHELTHSENPEDDKISWMDGQIYTIDTFLWFMARHGYTLQKTRTKLPFEDIEDTVQTMTNLREQQAADILLSAFGKNPAEAK